MIFVNTPESRAALRRLANYLDDRTNADALFDISTQNGFVSALRLADDAEDILGTDHLAVVSFALHPNAGDQP
jgi:hypothetical protein